MTRLEIIFELAKYCPSVIYQKILHWPTEELNLLLEIYKNDSRNLETLLNIFKRLDKVFEKIEKETPKEFELFEISLVPVDKTSGYKMDLWSYLSEFFGGTSVSIPKHCKLCGIERKGTFITGYYFDCEWMHNIDELIKSCK